MKSTGAVVRLSAKPTCSVAPAMEGVMAVFRKGGKRKDVIVHPSKHGDAFGSDPAVDRSKECVEDVPTDLPPEHGAIEREVLVPPSETHHALGAVEVAIFRHAADVMV